MTHTALAITLATLLALPGCSDYGTTGVPAVPASSRHIVAVEAAIANSLRSASPVGALPSVTTALVAAAPTAPTSAVGIYEIDTEATVRHAGFLASLIESKVQGATLDLRADRTYVGRENGEPESTGTWSIENGRLAMIQTHENGVRAEDRGEGTIRDGVLTLKMTHAGITVTLVFHHR